MIFDLPKQLLNDLSAALDLTTSSAATQAQLKTIIESALKKAQLVSREEFDIQQSVLLKTRARLETLEKHIAEIESQMHGTPNHSSETSQKIEKDD